MFTDVLKNMNNQYAKITGPDHVNFFKEQMCCFYGSLKQQAHYCFQSAYIETIIKMSKFCSIFFQQVWWKFVMILVTQHVLNASYLHLSEFSYHCYFSPRCMSEICFPSSSYSQDVSQWVHLVNSKYETFIQKRGMKAANTIHDPSMARMMTKSPGLQGQKCKKFLASSTHINSVKWQLWGLRWNVPML